MPGKHFWDKFEWDAWRGDKQLRRCSKETRGFWIDALAEMMAAGAWYIEGFADEICRDLTATRDEFERSIAELQRTGAASILHSDPQCQTFLNAKSGVFLAENGNQSLKCQCFVKVISRRRLKRANRTEYNRLKKREERDKKIVNQKSTNPLLKQEESNTRDTSYEVSIQDQSGDESQKPDPPRGRPQKATEQYLLPRDAETFGFAVTQFLDTFPDVRLTALQAGLIASEVRATAPCEKAWSLTLSKYIGNRNPETNAYDPQKLGNVLSVFRDELSKLEKGVTNSGNNRKSSQDARAERAVNKHDVIENVRQRSRDRANGISGGNAADSPRLVRGQLAAGDDRGGDGEGEGLVPAAVRDHTDQPPS